MDADDLAGRTGLQPARGLKGAEATSISLSPISLTPISLEDSAEIRGIREVARLLLDKKEGKHSRDSDHAPEDVYDLHFLLLLLADAARLPGFLELGVHSRLASFDPLPGGVPYPLRS
jgi:hypothetical protein